MGLKADASFLRFVTMGAIGTRAAIEFLQRDGFQPIEFERYCTSNKIWQTKVKRLRLPDLLCLRTGLRFEVRGKSTLTVKMSHAPNNPERAWDAGLRDEDIAAFLLVVENDDGSFTSPYPPEYFGIGDLRLSEDTARLGPPKSQSEGSERDLEWPTLVPKKRGRVTRVENGRISIFKPGENRPNYTYTLGARSPYVQAGDVFEAGANIIAGTVGQKAQMHQLRQVNWNPHDLLDSEDKVDRYAAVKALPHVMPDDPRTIPGLRRSMSDDVDDRVRLEAAGSLAKLGVDDGYEHFRAVLVDPGEDYLPMEVVLILSEILDPRASAELLSIAQDQRFLGQEIRQAAVWGLGRTCTRAYNDLVRFLGDDDDDVAYHAICAFGPDTPRAVIDVLVELMQTGEQRFQAAACEVLAKIGNTDVIDTLLGVLQRREQGQEWASATLGRMPREAIVALTDDPQIVRRLEPLFRLYDGNWLGSQTSREALDFLNAQVLE